jgi:crotonobetainyl-CoA:carnitine CoA-transferase CaiB-like acyl-CoA transferase
MTDLPLDGVRVLEISPGYAAGFAGRLLAGFGADVVVAGEPRDLTEDDAVWLLSGKRRVATAGFEAIRPLALAADLGLLDSRVPAELTIALRDRAEVIVVSITPFGQSGPYADNEATNITAFAMGGIVSLTGHESREPLVTGGNQAYALGGLNAFSAALAAYYGKLVHGEGDWIDISLQECSAAMLELYGPGSAATAGSARRRGNHLRAVWGIYPCAEGWAGGVASSGRCRRSSGCSTTRCWRRSGSRTQPCAPRTTTSSPLWYTAGSLARPRRRSCGWVRSTAYRSGS